VAAESIRRIGRNAIADRLFSERAGERGARLRSMRAHCRRENRGDAELVQDPFRSICWPAKRLTWSGDRAENCNNYETANNPSNRSTESHCKTQERNKATEPQQNHASCTSVGRTVRAVTSYRNTTLTSFRHAGRRKSPGTEGRAWGRRGR